MLQSSESQIHSSHNIVNNASSKRYSMQADGLPTMLGGDLDPVALATKRGHVIGELIETERSYVAELRSVLDGYLRPMEDPAMCEMIPVELRNMSHILFGNLEEIYRFHSE